MSTSVPHEAPSAGRPAILIVGYKAYDELEACLASIARHEPDARVIVVDHAADAVCGAGLAAAHPDVSYLPVRENPGFSAGVNRAAREAGARPLLLLNPDCELTGPVLDAMSRVLADHPNAGIVGGGVRETDGTVQASARAFPDWTTGIAGRTSWLTRVAPGNPLTRRNLKHDAGAEAPALQGEGTAERRGATSTDRRDEASTDRRDAASRERRDAASTERRGFSPGVMSPGVAPVDWVSGAFMLIRRDTFDALAGFDERFFLYWEDADFCRRALDAGWTTVYAPAAEVVHHTSRTAAHAPVRSLLAFHVSALRYHWKHGGLLARLLSPVVAASLAARMALRGFRAR